MGTNKTIIKTLLLCMTIFSGCITADAETLRSIEIKGNPGNIILDTDFNSTAKKHKISKNEVIFKLPGTYISPEIKTVYENTPGINGIGLIQDGSTALINVSGTNVSDCNLVYSNGEIIPTGSTKKDMLIAVLFGLITAISGIISVMNNNISVKRKENLRKIKTENIQKQQKIEREQKLIRDLKTLRNRERSLVSANIHGDPNEKFATSMNTGKMSIPAGLKSRHARTSDFQNMKNAVNT